MRKYDDLIYYKQDLIDEYSSKRKNLEKDDVEDLLRCALLYMEREVKNPSFTSFEVPSIGFLHKKLDFSIFKKPTKRIQTIDSLFVECAYQETTSLPIPMREEVLSRFYSDTSLEELQQIQNNK